ncbi:MAG: glycosyltransferase, partial [Deltaproteobacteria bacterium]|nr:glycosyltransferase [Deltaproteobacteria bacterium]
MPEEHPISILHLITTLDVGGAEMMLSKLLSGMDRETFSNHVICLTKIGAVGQEMASRGIPVYALNMPNGALTVKGLARLWRLLRSIRPKILQSWLYHADLLGLICGKAAGIRNICWNIRCSYRDLTAYRRSTKWVIDLCTLLSFLPNIVIVNSMKGLRYHAKLGYKPKRWKVIPNGFDLKAFKPDKDNRKRIRSELGLVADRNEKEKREEGSVVSQDETVLIGLIARYASIKDHPTFMKAACLLLEKRKAVHFVLAGRNVTWKNEALAGMIPDTWKDHFHLLGERIDVSAVTAALDIASLVSYGEGFPNIICEAMACCVPCVVTNVGDASRIVGDTGRVVPCRDPQAVAEAWNELIDLGAQRRHRLGLEGRKRVMRHFELSMIAQQYEKLYSSLVEPSRFLHLYSEGNTPP